MTDEQRARDSTIRESLASLTRRQSQMDKDVNRKISKIGHDQALIMKTLLELQKLIGPEHHEQVNEFEPDKDNINAELSNQQNSGHDNLADDINLQDFKPSLPQPTFTHGKFGSDSRPLDVRIETLGMANSRSAKPQRRLEILTFHPEEHPSRFREWVSRITQFQQYYQLSNAEAIAELQWYGGEKLESRLSLILAALPSATLPEICNELVRSIMPAGAAQMARRSFNCCRQLEHESGSSFIRRFQAALTEYRRFDNPREQRLYDDFLSQLNSTYFGELRTDTAETGPLERIINPASRLLAAFAAVRQIEETKCKGGKTYDELRAKTKPVGSPIANVNISATPELVCRTCEREQRDYTHNYKECPFAKQHAFCKVCRVSGHWVSKTCRTPKTVAVTTNSSVDEQPAEISSQ
jgi:hypothetical protein